MDIRLGKVASVDRASAPQAQSKLNDPAYLF